MKDAGIFWQFVGVAALAVAGVSLLPAVAQARGLHNRQVVSGTAFAPVAYAPVVYAQAPVAAQAFAPTAAQAFAPVAAAPAPTYYTSGYVYYTTSTASAPAAAGAPPAAAAPTTGSYYRWKLERVDAPKPKAARAPRPRTLKKSDADRVRKTIALALKDRPSATLSELVSAGEDALTTGPDNEQIKDISQLTPDEETDIRAIANDEMNKAREQQDDQGTGSDDSGGTADSGSSDQTGSGVAQQGLIPTMTPAAYAPVQLFVPTVHRCNIFCRH